MATDTFTRANETPIAAPWTIRSSTQFNLTSNVLTRTAAGDEFIYYAAAASSNDQYSQFLYSSTINNNDWGPAVRVKFPNKDGYWMDQRTPGVNKFVADAFTVVEALTFTTATGSTFRIEISGSTITCKKNGAEVTGSPSTDSSLATGQPGAFIFDTGGGVDNFDGGDLVSAVASPMLPMSAMQAVNRGATF